MNSIVAYLWLTIIGSNVAEFYSNEAAYQGIAIVVGTAYFVAAYHRQLINLLHSTVYMMWIMVLAIPIFLMLLSDRIFANGDYTSMTALVLVFIVSALLASVASNEKAIVSSAFSIVLISASMNLYELFNNNVWSISPGRSAGFYVNPNISSEALIAFACIFLAWKRGKSRYLDYLVVLLALSGIFATFSRGGILTALLLLVAATTMKFEKNASLGAITSASAVALFGYIFIGFVLQNLDLSEDATLRIFSLLDSGGLGDYESNRGYAAVTSLYLALEKPLFGWGVRNVYEMIEGPHNMFVAVMVDYGLVGLLFYLAALSALFITVVRGNSQETLLPRLFLGWLILLSFVSHNMLSNPSTMVFFGLAIAKSCQTRRWRQRPGYVS